MAEQNLTTVEDALEALFKSVPRDGCDANTVVSDVIEKLPADHVARLLSALAYRCAACGHTDFIMACSINMETGDAGCPACDVDGKLILLEGGAA